MKKIRNFMSKHKKLTAAAVVLILMIIAAVSCESSDTSVFEEETVSARDIYTYRSFVGNVEPAKDTSVISQVSQQVLELKVKKGDEVHEGDVIAVIDSSSAEESIELKEASLNSAKTSNSYNINDAQRSYDNYKEAIESGLNSSLNSADSSLQNAYDSLKSAMEDYEETEKAIDDGEYAETMEAYNRKVTVKANCREAKEAVNKAQEKYDEKKAAYDAAVDTAPESLETLKQDLENANRTLQAAKDTLKEMEKTYDEAKNNFESLKENVLDQKQNVIDQAWKTYDDAERNYDSTELSVKQQLETYEAALDKTKGTASASTKESEIELKNLKESVNDYVITAPCNGTVTELDMKEGSMVTSGTAVATISNLNNMQVSINVDEYSILDTAVGSSVTVIVDSIQKTYEGTLTYVADVATLTNGVAYFEATVDFEADEYIKSGMSVEVRLTSADLKNVTAVSVDAVYYNEDNTAYVLMKNEKSQEAHIIETGVSDGSYVEIRSGLEVGDMILKEPTGFVMPEPAN